MNRERGAVRLENALDRALWRHLDAGRRRVDERTEQPPERPGRVGGTELRELAHRLDLLRSELQRSDGPALLHQAAPLSRCEASASSCKPRGSSTSSGRPFPSTVVPARPLIRSIGGERGLGAPSPFPTHRSPANGKVSPCPPRTAKGPGPRGRGRGRADNLPP